MPKFNKYKITMDSGRCYEFDLSSSTPPEKILSHIKENEILKFSESLILKTNNIEAIELLKEKEEKE